jgi:hypothetical protein
MAQRRAQDAEEPAADIQAKTSIDGGPVFAPTGDETRLHAEWRPRYGRGTCGQPGRR